MIVYQATKKTFISDVMSNQIADYINEAMVREVGHSVGKSEKRSWSNSMQYMQNIISDQEIPNNSGIAIEYKIPQTSKRIDFIITGFNQKKKKHAIVVELKQWEEAKSVSVTDMDGVVVRTYTGGGVRNVPHPSYQVNSYAMFLEDYNVNIQNKKIKVNPCVYLHNYPKDSEITNKQYKEYIKKAPLFFKTDAEKLRSFIKKYVKFGDNKSILYEIEKGKIKPSKALADSLSSMISGNKEFILLDEQKVIYEKALQLSKIANNRKKQVFIIEGGPGTGKSVLAINLLSELTNRKKLAQYVTRNSAPREVFKIKLTGSMKKGRIDNMFHGSGSYYQSNKNIFDALIVDEAHRLNLKSGFMSNLGENQVKEIIKSSKLSVFFIDEDQRVTINDIGSKAEIKKWATKMNASITVKKLNSQFRCNGSDGYLSWIDNVLQIHSTANYSIDDIDYDFKVFNSPKKLHEKIKKLNKINNKSRVVAGYTWNWITKKEPTNHDIKIGKYKARWNLAQHGQSWIIHPNSVEEVGCIHTCQGLELDYVGVIIGKDLIIRNGKIITDYSQRAYTDRSLRGIKSIAKNKGKHYAQKLSEPIIKNTYRTLMTRGTKGCYIFSEDEETNEYFRKKISKNNEAYNNIDDGTSIL